MKKNMGTVDRVIRILIAVIILILKLTNVISGTLAVVLLILAGIFVLTSLVGICPLYLPFGLSTKKK
jgi:Inner membrane protein YgaP-like, transmembrane domain